MISRISRVCHKHLVGKAADARCTERTDYCAPAKRGESWVSGQIRTFGIVATGFRAFSRAVEKLQSESGRRNIMTWLSNAELRQKKHFALEELASLVDVMQKTEAGTNLSGAGSTAPAGAEADATASSGAAPDEAGATAVAEDHDGDLGLLGEEEPAVDPVLQKAESLAMSEMASISIHTDGAAFAAELKSTIYASSRPLVVVECPTSRQSTFFSLLDSLHARRTSQSTAC